MAIIKCPECGQDISDKSLTCIHCGYPISNENLENKNSKKKNIKQKQITILLISTILIVLCTITIFYLITSKKDDSSTSFKKEINVEQQISEDKNINNSIINESKKNISPYLEYIGKHYEAGEKIHLSTSLYNKMDNVEFMGMRGEIEFGTTATSKNDDYYVRYCSWTSFEGYTEDEFQSIAESLNTYFGCEADVDSRDYSKGHTYRYFWIDPDNNYYVTCGHGLFMYLPDGGIEVMWATEFCEGADFFGL